MMNADNKWRRFLRIVFYTWVTLSSVILIMIAIIDPHDNLIISPDIIRAPIDTNQRFSYVTIARNPVFDSAVFGTSTSRLIKPSILNNLLGGNFANLSMNSATAYEQFRLYDLFIRHHPNARTIIIGIDNVWCAPKDEYERFTFRKFPEWLYDENPWNDLLYIFNDEMLEQAIRQLEFKIGTRKPKYGFDGYENFLLPANEYDIQRARENIYGQPYPVNRKHKVNTVPIPALERSNWIFATHVLLDNILSSAPETATKILVFVPYHIYLQPPPGSRAAYVMDECKHRIVTLARKATNTHVLDFMIPSRFTREDSNYWDALHYTVDIAEQFAKSIANGVSLQRGVDDMFHYLGGSSF